MIITKVEQADYLKLIEIWEASVRATHHFLNEQNPQAVGFYLHLGFSITARSELDGQGNAFPLLHMV